MNKLVLLLLLTLSFGCTNQNESIEISYVKGGQSFSEEIDISKLIKESGKLQTDYIDQLTYENIDSVYFIDNNPDKISFYSTPVVLDFTKPIKEYSPEYYAIATAYYIEKCVRYYNTVFNNNIKFQDYNEYYEYRDIKVLLGDYALFSRPNQYILEDSQLFSPSIFYHEIGHVAFWYL